MLNRQFLWPSWKTRALIRYIGCNKQQILNFFLPKQIFFNLNLGKFLNSDIITGLSSLGVPWHTQILADQLTLFQPGATDYAHLITTGTPGFLDLPTVLNSEVCFHFMYIEVA